MHRVLSEDVESREELHDLLNDCAMAIDEIGEYPLRVQVSAVKETSDENSQLGDYNE